jgi:hypothetical protein
LTANTTYHFRIVASNQGGQSTGADMTFTTPPNPPSVETTGASSVAQTGATLNATVNPNGVAVGDCHFEYGHTTAYGYTAPCSPLPGAGASPVAVSAHLEGLTASNTYHFRIVASNQGGQSVGTDITFTTPPNPPSVETAAASSVAQSGATLNATVNPNGGTVGDCHFEYGTTAVFYEASMPCSSLPGSGSSPVAVSAQIAGLSANTTYHFRIVASNQGGTGTGSDRTFATPSSPPVISLVSPGAGPVAGGTTVSVTGVNLTEATNVKFGANNAASFAVVSPTSLTAVSPVGTGTVDVLVTTPGGTSSASSADRFSYVPVPTVTGLTPSRGPLAAGTTVTIAGTNLSGATSVKFGLSSAANFTVSSATSITAVAPAASIVSVVDVTVTTTGGTSLLSPADKYTFGPTITAVSPNSGPTTGGTSVTITGTGFAVGTSYTTVEFGGTRATSVTCSATTTCTAVSPAHLTGTVDVKAFVSKVVTARTTADRFTYA